MSNPFINTVSLKKFTLGPVDPNQIDIEDIAHALSHVCRFAGHTSRFYSVAQHSLMVSYKIPGTSREKLAALLHDAAEAFVCDIPSPVKPLLGRSYRNLYNRIQDVIDLKFGVPSYDLTYTHLDLLEKYDKAACVLEAQAFFGLTMDELEDDGFPVDLVGLWEPWSPNSLLVEGDRRPPEIKREFLNRFQTLKSEMEDSDGNA